MATHSKGGKRHSDKVDKLAALKVGGAAYMQMTQPALSDLYRRVRLTHPDMVFRAEAREGGHLVTRTA